MDNILRCWGGDFIHIQLPASLVFIDGLSTQQQRTIARDYASFAVGVNKKLPGCDVICHAGRLAQPVGLPVERFSANDQYSPLKRRTGAGIEVIGFDFIGHFVRGGPAPVLAELSVAKEEQLIWPSVLENFLRILLAHHVLDQGGVLLHSAGFVYQHYAYLFFGRSNAGKTTLARKAASAGARVLSDDINLVIPENGGYRAHKVPFTGEFGRQVENLSGCGSFPIGGLALLEKAPELTVKPVRPAEALSGLLVGCPFVNDDSEEVPALMDILNKIISRTPIIRMGVSKDDSFEAVIDSMLRRCKNA
jgi:hypothetical protein